MIKSDYVSHLASAIGDLEWARREVYGCYSVRGCDEHVQDIDHLINQITALIEDHCKQNVGEE